MAYNTQH